MSNRKSYGQKWVKPHPCARHNLESRPGSINADRHPVYTLADAADEGWPRSSLPFACARRPLHSRRKRWRPPAPEAQRIWRIPSPRGGSITPISRPNFSTRRSGCIGDLEAALGQKILDVAVAQGKAQIQPNRRKKRRSAGYSAPPGSAAACIGCATCVSAARRDPTHKLAQGSEVLRRFASKVGA